MFLWGGEINYEGTSLILSLLQLFFDVHRTTLCLPLSVFFPHRLRAVNLCLPRERWRCLLWASALSSGSAKEALFCILCE